MIAKIRASFAAAALAAFAFLSPGVAVAGSSCQYITTGAVLTAAQWNSCFQAKENELGYTPINKAGDSMTGLLTTVAPTTSTAGFRLNPGAAPTAPTNGDLWMTSTGLYGQVNGVTVGPFAAAGASAFAATSPITVSFPASVVTYGFDFTVANSWLATQTFRTILAGTTNTYDIGTSAAAGAFRTVYAGTSFVGPVGTFTTSVAVGGATIGGNALAVTGTSLFNSGVTMSAALTYGGVTLSNAVTGTGAMVLATSPALTTPNIGAATGTSTSLTGGSTIYNATAIPAGGTAGTGWKASSTTNFGTFFGSGAPTLSAAQGSLYLRSDGAAATRLYVNTNGTTGWSPFADSSSVSLVVGSTAISSGTTTRILYDNAGILGEYTISGSGTVVAMATSPVFTTPTLGVAGGTSLALNSCTIGSNGFCVTGTAAISSTLTSAAHTITSAASGALTVGLNGATNPALQIDASTASSATGLKVKSAAAAGGLALSVITSGTNENLTIDAAGSGTITVAGTSTGAITLTRATTISAALTYGGVTLSNSVTGTGSMVLSASPTFTGTPILGTPTATSLALGGCTISTNALCATGTANISGAITLGGAITYGGVTLSNAVTGTGNMVLATSPTLTTPVIGAATGTSIITTGVHTAFSATAIPAGGTAGSGYLLSSTSNYGVFFGSGAPTLSAAQGSLYLRSDGVPFYNSSSGSGTTWTSLASGSGTVTSVTCNGGLTGGAITTTGTCAVDIATTANIWAGTASKILDAANVFNGAGSLVSCTGTSTATCDFGAGFNFTFTATTATNYTIANPSNSTKVGQTGCIYLLQPAAGTVVTIAFGSNWKSAGGTSAYTLTSTLSAVDRICYIVRTSTFIDFSFANNIN